MTDVEAEAPILWPPDVKADSLEKTLMLGKIEGKPRYMVPFYSNSFIYIL